MRIRVASSEACSGCHLCEIVCSLYHLGEVNPKRAAIHIVKEDLGTSINTPRVCLQCKDKTCLKGEEVDERAEVGTFIWPVERAQKCPYGALHIHDGHAYHCDLCGGDPRCVQVCTTGAIVTAGKEDGYGKIRERESS